MPYGYFLTWHQLWFHVRFVHKLRADEYLMTIKQKTHFLCPIPRRVRHWGTIQRDAVSFPLKRLVMWSVSANWRL